MDPHACICDQPLTEFAGKPQHNWKCPQRSAAGLMCHKHYDRIRTDRPVQWEIDECEDCQAAHKENADRIQRTETIDPSQPYGQHIALTCKNHPDLRWSTKNIGWIGARSIFYFDPSDPLNTENSKPECSCPMSDLIVVKGSN